MQCNNVDFYQPTIVQHTELCLPLCGRYIMQPTREDLPNKLDDCEGKRENHNFSSKYFYLIFQ